MDGREVSLGNSLKRCVYNEADALEDRILFPEEFLGEMKDNLFKENPSEIVNFERSGPNIDPRRFAYDLDTDEELSENESNSEDISEGDSLGSSCEDLEQIGDGGGGAEDESTNSGIDMENTMTLFNQKFMQSLSFHNREDRMREFVNDADVRKDVVIARLMDQFSHKRNYSDMSHDSLDREFMRFLDRQKSKGE
jgi:hypothetical protein